MSDKRHRTRAALLQAARDVIREKGFHAASLQAVAERAGMSRGAIYGNFRSRESLLVAVIWDLWPPVQPVLRPGAGFREQMRIIGRAVADAAEQRRPLAIGAASFQLYALSSQQMRRRIARENVKIYAWIARELLKFIPQRELPMPVNQFVRVTHALSEGLMFGHFMTPDLIDRKVMIAAFVALAR
jgi:AcrR family transcriptional regulator